MQHSHSGSFATARLVTGLVVVTFIALACSGGGAASLAGTQSPTAAPGDTTAPTSAPVDSAAPTGAPGGAALKTAVVIIGSDRYEFTGLRCLYIEHYLQAVSEGGDPRVSIVLPPDGWESQPDVFSPPSVSVKIGAGATDGAEWVAGDEGWFGDTYPVGKSQIDSYSVPDGRPVTATGSATFSDQSAILFGRPSEPRTGTFEVTCP